MVKLRMELSFLWLTLLGSLFGVFSGFMPGLHPNLFKNIHIADKIKTSIFLLSVGIGFNFSQAFLVSIAGYRNFGYFSLDRASLKEIVLGGLFSFVCCILLFPIFSFLKYLEYLPKSVFIILFGITIVLTLQENFFYSLLFFITSGIYGVIILNLGLCNEPFLPMLSGFFGIPSLLFRKTARKEEINKMCPYDLPKIILASIFLASLPGITPVHSALLSRVFFKANLGAVLGGINFIQPLVSLFSWYFLDKPREGYLKILQGVDKSYIFSFLLVSTFSFLICCTFLLILLPFLRISSVERVKFILLLINVVIIYVYSGVEGIGVMLACLLLAFAAFYSETPLFVLSGSILIPTLLWYL